ncbi:hypothetical protein M407DRAFT_226715 [Tulasnella calospora MUT 4182]|uniref:Amine oxidase n=1 Tax=Tulasnella calospora MUT 4182 TaxID=1051891 RepID=A0A0C3Q443_9AGAM|nr:hypothetical protein M407DRAFT_226715 [Tulasnella calospora MUT 4182]
MLSVLLTSFLASFATASPLPTSASPRWTSDTYDVLILGGGVAGVMAAQQLHEAGIDNYLIVEARDELGGRMHSYKLDNYTVEVGCNWVQGTQTGNGPINPIYSLALKHKLVTTTNNWEDLQFYDEKGHTDFKDAVCKREEAYGALITGAGEIICREYLDLNARSGYSLMGHRIKDKYDWASEYYHFDWEWAQAPEQSSWIATSFNNNFTFDASRGGFSDENLLSVDQKGFKHILQDEAATFLKASNVLLSSTVKDINYSDSGVSVKLESGDELKAKYALVTFSVGVLQHPEDVKFEPAFPAWKQEAIDGMKMGTYTKIFLQWEEKFWDDNEMGLYADPYRRGYYPVWQSLDHERFFPGSGMYVFPKAGDESERVENLSDEQVLEEVMGVLKNMYPGKDIPRPKNMHFNRWYNDKLTRGAFSNWPASFYVEHQDNLRAHVNNLYFAGEHTSFEFYGYLQGAYLEGQKAGKAIASCVNGKGCVKSTGGDFHNKNEYFPQWYNVQEVHK